MKKVFFLLSGAILSTIFIGCGCSKSMVSHERVLVHVDSVSHITLEDPENPGTFIAYNDSTFVDIYVDKKGRITTKISSLFSE